MISMKNNKIAASWGKIKPDESANERMYAAIRKRRNTMEKIYEVWKKNRIYVLGGVAILLALVLITIFVRHLVLQTRFRDARTYLDVELSGHVAYEEIVLSGPEGEVPGLERDVDYYLQYIEDGSTICAGRAPRKVSPNAIELRVGDFSVWFTDQDGIWGWVQWMEGDKLVGYNVRGTLDFDHLYTYYRLAVRNRSDW